MFDDLDDSLSNTPPSFHLNNLEIAAFQRSIYNRADQIDYKKFFQKRIKMTIIKKHSSVSLNTSHSKANYILFDYILNYLEK